MTEFTPARSDAIRAALIDHAARDLHPASDRHPAASPDSATRTRPSPHGRRSRGPRATWFAAVVSLLLVGGVAGAVVTVAPGERPDTAATPTESGPLVEDPGLYVGSGLVLERDGVVQLCLGGVFQSIPPGCMAPVILEGWDWDQPPVPSQEASGVRFTNQDMTVVGTVQRGRTAAEVPTLTLAEEPIEAGPPYPSGYAAPPASPSGLSDDELHQIAQSGVGETIGLAVLVVVDGVIKASVAYDDGTLQQAADARYGRGVVQVLSLLIPAKKLN